MDDSVIEMTPTHKVGLRFKRSDAKKLREIAEHLGRSDHRRDVAAIFNQAADAAAGPDGLMIVICKDPIEAVLIAGLITRYGANAPAVEELSA